MTSSSVHPDNTLNELSGEEWLYFTKSLWTTAYPSELSHALRKDVREADPGCWLAAG